MLIHLRYGSVSVLLTSQNGLAETEVTKYKELWNWRAVFYEKERRQEWYNLGKRGFF